MSESFRDRINRGMVEQGYGATWKPPGVMTDVKTRTKMVQFRAPEPEDVTHRALLQTLPPRPWEQRDRSMADRLGEWRASELEAKQSRALAAEPLGRSAFVEPPRHAESGAVFDDPMPPGASYCRQIPEDAAAGKPSTAAPRFVNPRWRPQPGAPELPTAGRQLVWRLRQALRPVQRRTSEGGEWSRLASCGSSCASEGVGVVVDTETGRARFRGVHTCGSVWECPVCRSKICAQRTKEVAHVVRDWHGEGRALMLTATIRHGDGDPLDELAAGVSKAWRAFRRGAPMKRFAKRLGLRGSIRALEVTHGPNGWHPHIHAVWLFDEQPSGFINRRQRAWARRKGQHAAHVRAWAKARPEWTWRDEAAEWLQERWANMVARHMGERFRPRADEVGLRIAPALKADYIAKLGLELTDPGVKHGKPGHKSPWGIAQAWADTGEPRWAALWREYCQGMVGKRHLTWSRGLKAAAGLEERSDEDLAVDEEETTSTVVEVGTISREDWRILRHVETRQGYPAPVWLLEVVERRGAVALEPAVRAAVAKLTP